MSEQHDCPNGHGRLTEAKVRRVFAESRPNADGEPETIEVVHEDRIWRCEECGYEERLLLD